MNRKKYSRYRCVHDFIVAFENLTPGQTELACMQARPSPQS